MNRKRIGSTSYHSVWIPFLISVFLGLLVPQATAATSPTAFTITGTFDYTTAATTSDNPNDILITGISSSPEGEPNLIALRWSRVVQGWFPTWTLRLTSEAGLLPGADAHVLDLERVSPENGGVYRWALSYDPGTRALSLVITDERTGRVLASQGLELRPEVIENQAYPILDHLTEQRAHYVPAAAVLEIGTLRGTGAFFPINRLQPYELASIRLSVPGPMPPGEFHMQIRSAEGSLLHNSLLDNPSESVLILPLPTLPVGTSQVIVEYVDHGEVLWQRERSLQVGSVASDFGRAQRTGTDGPIATSVTFQAEADLPPIDVVVEGIVTPIVWDPESMAYHELPERQTLELLRTQIDLAAGEPFTIPLEFEPPADAGTYRLTLQPYFTPNVAGHITSTVTHFTTHRPAIVGPDEPYTIAILPDTQIYAIRHPDIFFRQAEWLAAQAKDLNIAFALHVGDVTNDNNRREWNIATDALKLLNHAVPYVLVLGNHDYVPPDRPGGGQVYSRDDSLIHDYFGPQDFPHMGGMMVSGRLDNTYHVFEVAGIKYLVVALEFGPSDEAVEWANSVIAAHPDHTAIVLTHMYLRADGTPVPSGSTVATYEIARDPSTSYNEGTDLWNKLLRQHESIRWVISGHRPTSTIPYRVSVGTHGNLVHQLLADYQSDPEGGGGYLILMTFYPDGSIEVHSYSPYSDTYKTDVDQYGFTNHYLVELDSGRVTALQPENSAIAH